MGSCKFGIVGVLTAGVFLNLFGQDPEFIVHTLEAPFDNVRLELIYEDPQRWLWLGSDQGLFRYDGQRLTLYPKSDSSSQAVTAVYRDRQAMLWVGYADGSIFHLLDGALVPWAPEEGLPAAPVVDILQDESNRMWIATYGEGLYYYQQGRMYNINTDDGLLGNDIYCMVRDRQNRVWVGTDRGISICSITASGKQVKNLTKQDGLLDDIVHSLSMDAQGNCWIGFYDNGLCHYDTRADSVSQHPESWAFGAVDQLVAVRQSEVLIGTASRGILRYDRRNGSLSRLEKLEGLATSKIYDLTLDAEGNAWALTNTHGLISANLQFEQLPVPFENIQALWVDQYNNLWVGTQSGLFFRDLAEGGASFQPQLPAFPDLNVISLYEDAHGILWIGTFGDGVFCFDPTRNRLRQINERDGLTNGSVLSIQGTHQKVWLATLGGVTEIHVPGSIFDQEPLSYRNYIQADGLGTNFIYFVFVDSRGRAWFATDGEGLSALTGNTIEQFNHIQFFDDRDSLRNVELQTVYSITEDRLGNIWFATVREGVFKYDGESFVRVPVKEGLRSLGISSLITDARGHILMVHPSGIEDYDPVTDHLVSFGQEVGLRDLDPNLNAFHQTAQGATWIADRSRIIRFNPMATATAVHPAMHLTGVSVNFEPTQQQQHRRFTHRQNNFVFQYKGLWYSNPSRVKYRYRLHGYDPAWIESRDEVATYSSLAPGQYSFEVASTQNDRWSDEPVVEYSFSIAPPIWQRAWFIILATIAGFGLLYQYLKARERRIQRLSLMEKEKIESQLAALKAQINPHFLFNSFNTLIDSIEENPPAAIAYVEKLADFYRAVLLHRDDEVIPLEEELKLFENFTYLLKKRFGDRLQIRVDVPSTEGFLPPLTLQLLVENAVKHNVVSKKRPLRIDIRRTATDRLEISNIMAPKSQREPSTHFGLQGLIKRYDLLGKYPVEVQADEQEFKVTVPIMESLPA